jgi:hypothetical protein
MIEAELFTVVADSTSARKTMKNNAHRIFLTCKIIEAKRNYIHSNYYIKVKL